MSQKQLVDRTVVGDFYSSELPGLFPSVSTSATLVTAWLVKAGPSLAYTPLLRLMEFDISTKSTGPHSTL